MDCIDERGDAGICNNQRQAYVTGGNVQILLSGRLIELVQSGMLFMPDIPMFQT